MLYHAYRAIIIDLVYHILYCVRMKEGNVLFNDTQHILFMVIWHETYGRGPLRYRERKPDAATWATLPD